jgi:hypothetical protein
MQSNLEKAKIKNHKMGLWSLLISFIPIIWIIRTAIIDIFFPPISAINVARDTYITMNIFFVINIAGIIVGSVSLFKNEYKKTLATWGIIINSIIPVLSIISIVMKS